MKNNNVPAIRFKGFTDAWEQRKLGELAEFSKGNGFSKMDLVENGTPVLLYGRLYTNYETVIKNIDTFAVFDDKAVLSCGGEVVVPASGESAEEISRASVISIPGVIIGGDLNVIKPYYGLESAFLALTISNGSQQKELSRKAQGKSVVHLRNSDLKEVNVFFPILAEQKRISNIVDTLDNLITLHQRKLGKLKELKKALLEKLFPKNGSKYPEVRFRGHVDAWELTTFGHIFAEVKSGLSRLLNDIDIGMPVIRANNIESGRLYIDRDIKYWYKNDPQGANTERYLVKKGDILINFINSESKMGTATYVKAELSRDTIYTTNILRCRVNKGWSYKFVFYITFLSKYINYIKCITKPAVNQASFTTVDFKRFEIETPSLQEQKAIGKVLEDIDNVINLEQRELELLQETKKAFLQKLFV